MLAFEIVELHHPFLRQAGALGNRGVCQTAGHGYPTRSTVPFRAFGDYFGRIAMLCQR